MAAALPIFAATLFMSAFLLFLVQPMIGKMILPKLGGTPQVWNTCMVFFQMALLAGYAYTHTMTTRVKQLRTQLLIHGVLLFVPLLLLFLTGAFNIDYWIPPPGANPIPSTLLLLATVVGLPFFVVSTSAPLLQRWFGHTGHPAARDPYFLYGASNLGSMLALMAYPVFVEPFFGLREQAWTWVGGYGLLIALFFVCVGLVWNSPPLVDMPGEKAKPALDEAPPAEPARDEAPPEPAPLPAQAPPPKPAAPPSPAKVGIRKGGKHRSKPQQVALPSSDAVTKAPITPARTPYIHQPSDVMTAGRRIRWVLLAAVPSSLMLGITTYISTDVSAIPLFWVLPLALYLLSFILVFLRWPVQWTTQPHSVFCLIHPFVLLPLLLWVFLHRIQPIWFTIGFCMLTFFVTAMVCHGELARDRPGTRYLTEFYLWLSVGGMLGGMFNALFAPIVFDTLLEFPIAIAVACGLRPFTRELARMEPIVALVLGTVVVVIGAAVLAFIMGFMGMLIGAMIGIMVCWLLYQSQESGSTEGWTEQLLLSIFPGLGDWAKKKGQELSQPTSGSTTTAPASVANRDPYYVLSYVLDVALPILVAIYFALVLYNGANESRWNWTGAYNTVQGFMRNPIFRTLHHSLGFSAQTAAEYSGAIARALIYGVPLLFCFIFTTRPMRFGFAALCMVLVYALVDPSESEGEGRMRTVYRGRSYFGILKILDTPDTRALTDEEVKLVGGKEGDEPRYTYLMHGTTHHGLNYQEPRKLRRLATTYYHRRGPAGVAMEDLNWFKGPQNTYWSDARMPASLLAASIMPATFVPPLPAVALVDLWSEPPYATIGLGTGTMASYARPFQHMAYYEIDHTIRSFSLPSDPNKLYFNYVHDALERGAFVEIIMGDARLAMFQEQPQEQAQLNGAIIYPHRDKYYRVLVVDAFSSDAIPVHLITKQGIQLYMSKMCEQGIVCVHTSNRHVDLVKPVTDICKDLGIAYRVGNDLREAGGRNRGAEGRGHFQSEYVLLANKEEYLPAVTSEASRDDEENRPLLIWQAPAPPGMPIWTDDYSNLMSVFRWGFGRFQ